MPSRPAVARLGYAKATLFALAFPVLTGYLAASTLNQLVPEDLAPLITGGAVVVAFILGLIAARAAMETSREDSAALESIKDPRCLLDLREVMSERRDWLYAHHERIAATPGADVALTEYAEAVKQEYQRFLKGHIGFVDPKVSLIEDRLLAHLEINHEAI